ncbi:MAG: FAD-binding oxidoreductase [Rhizobiales bacterium]|nr:FAD-binding oxidoreductase [Hyphomicrobiales bacterium]
MTYPQTYYAERLEPKPDLLPELEGHVETETCIIGGGLAGLSLASMLRERGQNFVLLEGERIAWGASGRNGGFVSAGFAQSVDVLEKRVGLDGAKKLFAETVAGRNYVRKNAEKMGNVIQGPVIQGEGKLTLLRHNAPGELEQNASDMNEHYGRRYEVLSQEALSAYVTSDIYKHGFFDPDSFTMDPLAYLRGLLALHHSQDEGVYEGTKALSVQREGADWVVKTAKGRVTAKNVVLTGSAYLGDLYKPLSRAILPVATYVVTTDPLGPALDDAIRFRGGITDTRLAGDYYRRIEESSLLWGGRITTQRAEPRHLAELLKHQIIDIYPQLSELKIRHAWSGLMGYAVHKMPIIGEMEPGLWSCTGFGGHGLSATAAGAQIIADALVDGDDRWRIYEPFKMRWGGGAIGRAGTQLVYWGMRLQDIWREKK